MCVQSSIALLRAAWGCVLQKIKILRNSRSVKTRAWLIVIAPNSELLRELVCDLWCVWATSFWGLKNLFKFNDMRCNQSI